MSGAEDVHLRTTLDPTLQLFAERSVSRALSIQGGRIHATQAAVVAMRADGSVIALVGGRDHRFSPFNRATQAERQPGSTFKVAVALAALRSGMTPDSIVTDEPITIDGWSPKNFDGSCAGEITLRRAFAESRNAAFVWIAEKVGLANVAQAAWDLGLTADSQLTPSMALGTTETTLMALTSDYSKIQGGCLSMVPFGLSSEIKDPNCRNRLPDDERNELMDLLKAVVARGTGTAAHVVPDAAGKTGTTSGYRDAWFIGFNQDVVLGVGVGNDDHSPMKGVTGGGLPAGIWVDVMKKYTAAMKAKNAPRHH